MDVNLKKRRRSSRQVVLSFNPSSSPSSSSSPTNATSKHAHAERFKLLAELIT